MADFGGTRARVADIKARQLRGRHKDAGAEVEEARAGRALPAPMHYTAPKEVQSNGQHLARAPP